jgi:hypothetical protein
LRLRDGDARLVVDRRPGLQTQEFDTTEAIPHPKGKGMLAAWNGRKVYIRHLPRSLGARAESYAIKMRDQAAAEHNPVLVEF